MSGVVELPWQARGAEIHGSYCRQEFEVSMKISRTSGHGKGRWIGKISGNTR